MNDNAEYFNCIYDCVTSSIEGGWRYSVMQVSFSNEKISSKFFYENDDGEIVGFRPLNFIAPLNAADAIKRHYDESGVSFDGMEFRINKDGVELSFY